jgi:Zn-dependent protease
MSEKSSSRKKLDSIRSKVSDSVKISPDTAEKIDGFITPLQKQYQITSYNNIPVQLTLLWVVLVLVLSYSFTTAEQLVQIQELLIENTPFLTGIELTEMPDLRQFIFGFITVVSIYGSVLIHEFGHAVAADKNNVTVNSITLWVLGGVAKIELQNITSRKELEIAIAGPIVSILISVTMSMLTVIASIGGAPELLTLYLLLITTVNISIAVFNLLPIFPLDGGRILRAALKQKHDHVTATKHAVKVTQGSVVILLFYGVTSIEPFVLLLSGFVYQQSRKELKQAVSNHRYDKHTEAIDSILRNEDEKIEFVNKTQDTIPTQSPLFLNPNNYVVTTVTDSTDYIITTEDKKQLYESTAEKHGAEILLISYLPKMQTNNGKQ